MPNQVIILFQKLIFHFYYHRRFAHPEFLPPSEPEHRDAVRELLERQDMLKRRSKLDIPEFYVGKSQM